MIGNILDGVYHHVAIVRVAADHYQSYVDGQLIQDIDPTPQTPHTTTVQRGCIGALCRAGTQLHFNGGIDEVQIFDSALDAPTILAFFDAGSAGTCKSLTPVIEGLVSSGVLNQGQGNALLQKLEVAQRQLDRGNVNAAVNQLVAFINQVSALINAGVLTPEEGQPLIDTANAIINQL